MIKDEIDEIVERQQAQHHGRPNERQLRMKKIRNWLNIAFMVIAMAGVIIYLAGNMTIGLYVIIASLPFKFVDAAIRILRM